MTTEAIRQNSCITTLGTMEDTGNVDIAINQVEYSNSPDGPVIHIFGRDTDGRHTGSM